MGDFFLGHDFLLGKDFHGIDPLGVLLSHLEHLAERPAADELEEFKVSRGQCALVL